MKKQKKGIRFNLLYLSAGIFPMIVAVLVLAIFSTVKLKEEVSNGIVDELKVAAEQVKEYFTYDVESNGSVDYEEYSDHEYIESLQESEDIELTLFEGNVRLLTSLKKTDGTYNEGSTAADDIYAVVKSGSDYSAQNVTINNTKYFVYYTPIYDGNNQFWGMGFAGKPMSYVNSTVSSLVTVIVLISVILVVAIGVLMFFLAKAMARTLTVTTKNIERLSQGNLDADFTISSIVTEFNEIVAAADTLQNQLLVSVGGAKSTANELNEAVANVDELSNNSAEGTDQIAQAVNELATSAQSMAESVQDANTTVVEMGESIDRITEALGSMNSASDKSMDANSTTVEYMGKLNDASNRSAKTVEEISDKVSECNAAAEKIQVATVAISEIASQTNLLSLNASIEAARAGEAGRGFAVVASEIQSLADQSSKFAKDIQDVTNEITAKVGECVAKTAEMTKVIEEQMTILSQTEEKINDMSVAGQDVATEANAINDEAGTLMKLKENVMSSISDLSAISEENAASSEEVTASVENIASAVASTKDESAAMRGLAEDLTEKMAFFKI